MLWVRSGLVHLVKPTQFILAFQLKFGFNRLQLFFNPFCVKQGLVKETHEAVECLVKISRVYGEVIIAKFSASPCVVVAAMATNKGLITVCVGVFFCAQKQHVL